jgi:transcription initiation factor TFIIIB Brf1 subunit/transcription initiation factor TFIIB
MQGVHGEIVCSSCGIVILDKMQETTTATTTTPTNQNGILSVPRKRTPKVE